MEYMLLRDNSVRVFECLSMHSDVLDALADYDGVAYYWHTLAFNWSRLVPTSPSVGNNQISDDQVPDVIKLAAMLE